MIIKEYSYGENLFFKYAGTLAVKLDKEIISDEKYDKLYNKLLEWKLDEIV
jgi:hypothetical protein